MRLGSNSHTGALLFGVPVMEGTGTYKVRRRSRVPPTPDRRATAQSDSSYKSETRRVQTQRAPATWVTKCTQLSGGPLGVRLGALNNDGLRVRRLVR